MSNISGDGFEIGAPVLLHGLKATHLNGQMGHVATVPTNSDDGTTVRQAVDLLNPLKDPETGQLKHERLMVKIENLIIDALYLPKAHKMHEMISKCSNCNKNAEHKSFMVCSKCRIAQYCSKDCQVTHCHNGHKSTCTSLRAFRKTPTLTSDDPRERSRQEASFAKRLLDRGKYSKAETHFRAAIEALKPLGERGILYASLGLALAFQGKFDEAKTAYEKATMLLDKCEFAPSNHTLSVVHANFGTLLGQTGDYEGAIQKYEKAIQLDPIYGHHYRNLAKCCEAVGRFREAAEAREKFVSLCPDSEDLGMAYGYCAQDIRRDLLENRDIYSPVERKQQEAKEKEMVAKAFEIDPNLPFFRKVSK